MTHLSKASRTNVKANEYKIGYQMSVKSGYIISSVDSISLHVTLGGSQTSEDQKDLEMVIILCNTIF